MDLPRKEQGEHRGAIWLHNEAVHEPLGISQIFKRWVDIRDKTNMSHEEHKSLRPKIALPRADEDLDKKSA